MSRIINVLEKYVPEPEDEKRFVDKHVTVKHGDRNGNKDDVFKASKVSKSKTREADLEDPEDEKVYEKYYSVDDVVNVLKSSLSEEASNKILSRLENTKTFTMSEQYFIKYVSDAIDELYDVADEDEKNILDEMLATDNGYEELLEIIFEASKDEDDDDDEDEDDDDDEDEDDDDDEEDK